MSYSFVVSSYFVREAKRLSKKYPSFKKDLAVFQDSLLANPLQGVELSPGIRKLRMAVKSKGKGKSGGVRIITYNMLVTEHEGTIVLLLLYDKEDASTVKLDVVKEILQEEGFLDGHLPA